MKNVIIKTDNASTSLSSSVWVPSKRKKMKSLISAHPIRWSVLGVGSISSSVHDQSADRTQSAGRARCTFDETLVIEDFEMTFYDIELDLRLSV